MEKKLWKYIEVEVKSKEIEIRLNRPEKYNALHPEMIREVISVLKIIRKEKKYRLLILRGNGKSFCSGADLEWMTASSKSGFYKSFKDSKLLARLFYSLYSLPIPVIGVVQGKIYGGGIGLTAACDLVLGVKGCEFTFSEPRLGIAPSTIMPYVLNRIKNHIAKEFIFTTAPISDEIALQNGLINHLVDEDELEQKISTLKIAILKSSPNAIKETKKLINNLDKKFVNRSVIRKTIKSLTKIKSSDEAREGLSAYIQKRMPFWA